MSPIAAVLIALLALAAGAYAPAAGTQHGLDAVAAQVRGGDCSGAMPALRSLAAGSGLESSRAAFLHGWCLSHGGQHAAAAAAYRAAAVHPSLGDYARVEQAAALIKTGGGGVAAAMARSVAASAPVWLRWRALVVVGDAELATDRGLRSVAAFEAAVRLRPEEPDIWMRLARAAQAAGRRDVARRAYARAAWAFPGHVAEREARDALARLLGREPAGADVDPESRLLRGRRLAGQGAWEQALVELRGATAAPPGRIAGEAWYRLGEVLLYSDLREAHHAFRRAAAAGWNTAGAWFWAASAARRAGMLAQAREAAAAFQRVAPAGSWTGRFWLGAGLRAEGAGRFADAARHYRRAVEAAPTADDAAEARWRLGWLSLRGGRPGEAAARFKIAADTAPWRSAAARAWYWRAKSLESSSAEGDRTEAARILRIVAEQYALTFYGQRARARLGLGPAVHQPAIPQAPRGEIAVPPHEELARLGFDIEAADAGEEAMAARPNPRLARFLAEVHARLGNITRSVAMADDALAHDLRDEATWRLAYPRAYWTEATAAAQAAGVDPLLLLALVREESRYDAGVISPARAVGLAQLLPSTAQAIARNAAVTPETLKDPGLNLKLGARYLRLQLDRFDGDLRLALAAYNAGPGAARRWANLDADPDYFVERLPYAETRGYVRRVLGSYGVYRSLW